MEFRQHRVGDVQIYAVALDSSAGGYTASVEVRLVGADGLAHQVIYSNEELFSGRSFDSANEALSRAMDVGHGALRGRQAVAGAPQTGAGILGMQFA